MSLQPYVESNDILDRPDALLRRLTDDGYLFFRGLLPREAILNVRRQILDIYQAVGWLRPGTEPMEGIARAEPFKFRSDEYLATLRRVMSLADMHALKLHPALTGLMSRIYGEPAFPVPTTIPRMTYPLPEETTQPHQDWLYVQGSTYALTTWLPLGDLPLDMGGLQVVAGSHTQGFLVPHKALGAADSAVHVDPDVVWRSSPYQAGDVIMFNALTVHGALVNRTDRYRLSVDFRYVGQSQTISESWLAPHFQLAGYTWDELDRDWPADLPIKRYWERWPVPIKTIPHQRQFYA
jgi:hypothetical protein